MASRILTRPTIRRGSIKEFFAGDPNLKGCWSLDGHARDESGNGNHGTLVNSPTYFPGKLHQSIYFDNIQGGDENPLSVKYITVPYSSSMDWGSNPFSVVCVFKTDYNAVPSFSNIIWSNQTLNMTSTETFGLNINTGVLFDYNVLNGSGKPIFSNKSYSDSKFHCSVLTRTTTTRKIYVDGILDVSNSTQNSGDTWQVNSSFLMGAYISTVGKVSYPFDGFVEEVGIILRELSPSEISQYYQWAISEPRKYWYYSPQIITGVTPYYYQELCKRRTA